MPKLQRNFLRGVMNKDDDERVVRSGTYRDALNIDIVHSEGEDAGAARNMKGNTKIGDIGNVSGTAATNARVIGATKSEVDNLIYYLVAADEFDGVYEYSETTGNIVRVLQSNKATPTTASQLNFNKNNYVTGINFLDGFLFWTDNLNEPFGGKISRWKSYNISDPRMDNDLRVIKSAPLHAPMIDMIEEPGKENNMEERFLQFSYRWKYVDSQYSAIAPFSGTAFVADDYFLDYGAGENKAMLNQKNRVKVTFRTGNQFVEEIELLVRDSKDLNVYVVESFDKDQLGLNDNDIHNFQFSNSKKYRPLDPKQVTRNFDNVPLKAGTQEVIDRRLVYGNYVQFYDIVDSNKNDIEIKYQVGHVSKDTVLETPIQTFRSNRDYEIGIQYGDSDGRFSTPLTSETNTTYIPPELSVKGNSITVSIDNKPPDFATNYRLVIKQSKGNYYSIFPILYYADGMYRYFLVNDFDRDKIRVGDYLIFKADLSGPTTTAKKYKVLEFENKPTNFINLGNINEIPGLYFKIKVENNSEFSTSAITTFNNTATGVNSLANAPGGGANTIDYFSVPIKNRYRIAEPPIHYGVGDENVLSVLPGSGNYALQRDLRFTVRITSQTTYEYTFDVAGSSGWVSGTITPNTYVPLLYNGTQALNIQFSNQSYYSVGDMWKINCRGDGHLQGNTFGGVGLPRENASFSLGDWGGGAVLPGIGWSDTDLQGNLIDKEIKAGAVIRMRVIIDRHNPTAQPQQQFPPSPSNYRNIEEWFYESGAYTQFQMFDQFGTDVGARAVSFCRALTNSVISGNSIWSCYSDIANSYSTVYTPVLPPVQMIIQGFGVGGQNTGGTCWENNAVQVNIDIQQSENLAICETDSIDSDTDIYYETTRTYPIENGAHKVLWDYQDFTAPAYAIIGGVQYTNLGQTIPNQTPSGIDPHYFQVGDQVEVTTTNGNIAGVHTILAVDSTTQITETESKYNIIIDLPFPGSGPVTPGSVGFYHPNFIETDQDQTNPNTATPARILINAPNNTNSTYNAYAFGNGLESNRIRDNFNSTTLEYSPRSSTVIEDYKQERKESSLTFSGVYRGETSVNALNEFNLATINYKNLDAEFGSIQKLFARDTNLVVFQEDKVSKVLYGKNQLVDSEGGGSITSVNSVLGTQISFPGEWGISFNPESFAEWANHLYWTDSRRGTVLKMAGEQIVPISRAGMKDYFRDLFRDNPNTQKIGVYDPYKRLYIIASNEETSKPCSLSISNDSKNFPGNPTTGATPQYAGGVQFFVNSNTSWTTTVSHNWVTNVPASGYGSQGIAYVVADNNTGSIRTATITFTYCDGKTEVHTIKQGIGKSMNLHVFSFNNTP